MEIDTLSDALDTRAPEACSRALVHPDVTGRARQSISAASTWLSGQAAPLSSIQFFGLRPGTPGRSSTTRSQHPWVSLSLSDTALVDTMTRFVDMRSFAEAHPEAPVPFEMQNRQLGAVGTVSIGGGFGGDGGILVSDQTFFQLFPQRSSATPSHIRWRSPPASMRAGR